MKILAIGALAIAAQVASCSGSAPSISTSSVQAAAATACKFAPTAETIINMVAANPALSTAEAVAAAICAAIGAPSTLGAVSTAPVVAHYVVNGKDVAISGTFVK